MDNVKVYTTRINIGGKAMSRPSSISGNLRPNQVAVKILRWETAHTQKMNRTQGKNYDV